METTRGRWNSGVGEQVCVCVEGKLEMSRDAIIEDALRCQHLVLTYATQKADDLSVLCPGADP